MNLDLTTLEKIRAEVERRMKMHANESREQLDKDNVMIAYDFDSRYVAEKNILHYLDTEIANAKNHD